MNTVQVNCFLSAAKTGNYSRTAEELLLEQPAVSRYIRNLENELSVKLFFRDGRRMCLTAEGRQYVELFSRFESEFFLLSDSIRKSAQPVRQIRYTIASVWSMPDLITQNQQQFQAKYPDIPVSAVFCSSDSLTLSPDKESVDLVFHMCKYLEMQPDMSYVPIGAIPNVIVYSGKHPVAGRGEVTMDKLNGSTFVYLSSEINSDTASNRVKTQMSEHYHISVSTQGVSDYETLISMVENGHALLLMDIWCHALQFKHLHYIALDSQESVGIGWPGSKSTPEIQSFVAETCAFFKQAMTKAASTQASACGEAAFMA